MTGAEELMKQVLRCSKRGQQEAAIDLLLKASCSSSGPDLLRNVLETQDEMKDGTALMWASSHGCDQLVELLLILGAKVNSRAGNGSTSLHAAADRGRLNVIRHLLDWGANVKAQTKLGDTACHLAAYRGFHKAVCMMINAGADGHMRNWRGNDVIDEANAGKQPHAVKVIEDCLRSMNTLAST